MSYHRFFTTIRTIIGRGKLWIGLLIIGGVPIQGWGFFAHRAINAQAIFLLPLELLSFYKKHADYIREASVKPDKRRYVIPEEGKRHYINIENYERKGELPPAWQQACDNFDASFRDKYGILPWYIVQMKRRLTYAFKKQDLRQILRLSADIGHYIADAHVPLHTTENHDGQLTGQRGIHGLWESRLPELFAERYSFFFEKKATYIADVQTAIWEVVRHSHAQAKMVLMLEKELDACFPAMGKYCYERRGTTLRRMYSRAYAERYHQLLAGMVANQMRLSIHMVASIWLTCWVDAGCPPLPVAHTPVMEKASDEVPKELLLLGVRPHEH